jgi:hypothetical protein
MAGPKRKAEVHESRTTEDEREAVSYSIGYYFWPSLKKKVIISGRTLYDSV